MKRCIPKKLRGIVWSSIHIRLFSTTSFWVELFAGLRTGENYGRQTLRDAIDAMCLPEAYASRSG